MGHFGNGYGSECHLLRFLGRHRDYLNKRILEETGGERIDWLDFNFNTNSILPTWPDIELRGLEFLTDPAARKYEEFFPSQSQNWDAVGRLWKHGEEILLVEAKANTDELSSNCAARSPASVKLIHEALAETKSFLSATGGDWTKRYYQYCNRLATLYFLNHKAGIPARMLFIYFLGDTRPHSLGDSGTMDDDASPDSPTSEPNRFPGTKAEWQRELKRMKEHVGLPPEHKLRDRIHELYLHVRGAEPI